MNAVVLRPVSEAAAPVLAGIHRDCFPNYWNHEAFTDFFSVAGTQALLAEAEEPVGMVVFRVQFEQADIITLAVRPAWRRQGIAHLLLDEAMVRIRQTAAQRLFLDVEDGNTAALQLYERRGFTLLKRRKQYYKQKDGSFTDALVMQYKLS